MRNYITKFLGEHGMKKNDLFYVIGLTQAVVGIYRVTDDSTLINVCMNREEPEMLAEILAGQYMIQSMEARRSAEERAEAVA